MLSIEERNRRVLERLKKDNPGVIDFSGFDHNIGSPTKPCGHVYGIRTSTGILRSYRKSHRPESQYVEPDQVIEVFQSAGIKQWVLMGLYGYVGYLAEPRATQDVDVLVAESELEQAITAICERWPVLHVQRTEVVIRFRDPGEIAITGEMKQVIDLMRPSDDVYRSVLKRYHTLDASTGHRIPTIEAACASKFAELISPNRAWEKKQQDAVDLRNILVPNQDTLDKKKLRTLGDKVYAGGGLELLEFLQLAIDKKPFPV